MEKHIEILEGADFVVDLALPKSSDETILGVRDGNIRVKFDVAVEVCGVMKRGVCPSNLKRYYTAINEDGDVVEIGSIRDARFETRRRTLPPGTYTFYVSEKEKIAPELVSGWRISEAKKREAEIGKVGLVLCNYRLQNKLLAFDKSCETLRRFRDENNLRFEIVRYAEPSDAKSFDYAAEINAKIQNAVDDKCDIIVVCDADSFLTEDFWQAALTIKDKRIATANGVDVSTMYYLMRGLSESAKKSANKIVALASTSETWKTLRFVASDKKVPFFDKLCNGALDKASFEVGDVVAHSYHGRRPSWKVATEAECEQYLNAVSPRLHKCESEARPETSVVEETRTLEIEETAEAEKATPKKRSKRKNKKEIKNENEDENV